jgi:hypothetical protein
MGNWHCVSSSCAEVVYRQYEPPKVRFMYPNEPWQEIIGDDYSVGYEPGKCNTSYLVKGVSANNGVNYCQTPVLSNPWQININGILNGLFDKFVRVDDRYSCPNYTSIVGKVNFRQAYLSYQGANSNQIQISIMHFYEPHVLGKVCQITEIKRVDGLPDRCGNCIFKVFFKGKEVYTEARPVCPQVQKIPCKVSDTQKVIRINKLPYLDRIEVIPWAYDVRWGLITDSNKYGFLLVKGKIPDECLNIYSNSSTSLIPTNFGTITNTPENGFNLIAQICSAPGCPPPEYTVICDCDCQSCPDGTCPIECGDHICCYNDYGVSVQSIPASDYCGGNS